MRGHQEDDDVLFRQHRNTEKTPNAVCSPVLRVKCILPPKQTLRNARSITGIGTRNYLSYLGGTSRGTSWKFFVVSCPRSDSTGDRHSLICPWPHVYSLPSSVNTAECPLPAAMHAIRPVPKCSGSSIRGDMTNLVDKVLKVRPRRPYSQLPNAHNSRFSGSCCLLL
jgi:hypothetical protein